MARAFPVVLMSMVLVSAVLASAAVM